MKTLPLLLLPIFLASCGSYKQTLENNSTRLLNHQKLQVNRLSALDKCWNSPQLTDKSICAVLQAQLQTEMGFTASASLSALPTTPEEQILEGAKTLGALYIGNEVVKGISQKINAPPTVLETPNPLIIDRPTPFVTPPAATVVDTPPSLIE